MNLQEMQSQAIEVAELYAEKNRTDNHRQWDLSAYMAGFVGDVGDLSKLVMARANYRDIADLDAKIAHELSDCLWSVLILAKELDVDLEEAFVKNMNALEERISHG